MKNKIYSIVKSIYFIILVTFIFLNASESIMSNYYIKITYYIILIITLILGIKDILSKVRKIVKESKKYMVVKIIFYILLTLSFLYLLISSILNLMYSI